MLALRQWSPFASMSRLHREIDQLFDRLFGDRRDWWTEVDSAPAFVPAIEAYVDGNQLHVRGGAARGRPEGFERAVTLPEGAETEKINARYENGVLDITLPVKETFVPKRVPIEVASGEMKSLKAA
jgi:HSP20 family protein